jgi:hypothetical protein
VKGHAARRLASLVGGIALLGSVALGVFALRVPFAGTYRTDYVGGPASFVRRAWIGPPRGGHLGRYVADLGSEELRQLESRRMHGSFSADYIVRYPSFSSFAAEADGTGSLALPIVLALHGLLGIGLVAMGVLGHGMSSRWMPLVVGNSAALGLLVGAVMPWLAVSGHYHRFLAVVPFEGAHAMACALAVMIVVDVAVLEALLFGSISQRST